MSNLPDGDFIEAEYIGLGGNHHVHGVHEFDFDPGVSSKRKGQKWVINYGYISGGSGIPRPVYKEDLRLMPGKWRELPKIAPPPVAHRPAIEPPKPLKPPAILRDVVFDLETLPGVTPKLAEAMREAGIRDKADIIQAGVEGLTTIKGIAENRARVILRAISPDS